ncbi:MAG: hypothetical protein LBK46_10285 [Oscillospiraceae bacterium]|jgi:hypothetical protein|nr:hypothetical protein [Oscillospiraceae bacterium]
MAQSCGYYNSYYGSGNQSGCACSVCGGSLNTSGGFYGYGNENCCGQGGIPAGPGLYDSRCFIPIPDFCKGVTIAPHNMPFAAGFDDFEEIV